ncbi:MAG TPA: double-strand break repair protein AddB, partial [Bryobacterales bacterium]|nr:double-strand break repair protein AddB [Bryobacterales bacterium]
EENWRAGVEKVLPEISGKLELDARMAGKPVTLSAKADRVDVLADGAARIFDYKTGTLPSADPEAAGYDAQLDLEAAMLLHGAFRGQPAVREVADALYVRVNGGWPPGETRSLTRKTTGFPERAELALDRLSGLLKDYGREDQPYLPVGHGPGTDRPSDYEHLSRWREWIFHLVAEEER